MLNIFSLSLWPFVHLHWKNIYSVLLRIVLRTDGVEGYIWVVVFVTEVAEHHIFHAAMPCLCYQVTAGHIALVSFGR